ncbi:MAG: hypothetical protein ABEJ77_06435 [Halanaeroarchaeum sp.]
MQRAVPALVGALLVVASVGASGALLAPADRPRATSVTVDAVSTNTSDVLALDGTDRAGFGRADLSVTQTLDAASSTLATDFQRHRLAAALDAANTDAERRRIVRNATAWVERETAELRATERQMRAAYRAGDRSARAYLTTLGRLHARATALERTVQAIATADVRTEGGIQHLRARLRTFQGPVRAALAAAMRGESSPRVFVAASASGVALSTIDDGAFVRGAVRYDNLDDAVGSMAFDEAETRFGELYPWTSAHKQRISMGAIGADVYVVEYTHSHGTLAAALDGSTGRIFREVQTKRLSSLPVETTVHRTGNLTIGVSRTYGGGPLRVTVGNATGAPVADATVTVNGTTVGTTSAGAVWTISPVGEYPIVVSTDAATVQVVVDPTSGVVVASANRTARDPGSATTAVGGP